MRIVFAIHGIRSAKKEALELAGEIASAADSKVKNRALNPDAQKPRG